MSMLPYLTSTTALFCKDSIYGWLAFLSWSEPRDPHQPKVNLQANLIATHQIYAGLLRTTYLSSYLTTVTTSIHILCFATVRAVWRWWQARCRFSFWLFYWSRSYEDNPGILGLHSFHIIDSHNSSGQHYPDTSIIGGTYVCLSDSNFLIYLIRGSTSTTLFSKHFYLHHHRQGSLKWSLASQ
jgi:hypothetical protein